MITLKIQCGCGQRYAFDVEPVAGRMPANVNCPLCGADGTAAANEILAQNSAARAVGKPTPSTRPVLRPAPSALPDHSGTPARGSLLAAWRASPDSGAPRGTKKANLFSKIQTREDALEVTKDVAATFFVVAVVHGGVGALVAPGLLVDALAYAILAALLRAWKSRVVAVLLFGLTLGAVWVTLLNKLGLAQEGGTNIYLALLVAWAALRAVQATFLLHGKFAKEKARAGG